MNKIFYENILKNKQHFLLTEFWCNLTVNIVKGCGTFVAQKSATHFINYGNKL